MATFRPAPATELVRVVGIDSVPLAGSGLAYLARRYPDLQLVGSAQEPAQARALVAEVTPEVAVIGDGLAGSGAELVAGLRADHPELGLVVVAHHTGDEWFGTVRDAGASAFVGRSAPVTAVVSAIRHASHTPGAFRTFGIRMPAVQLVGPAGSATGLSRREQQVLALLREGHSHAEVASALQIREGTVRTYVARLYSKLGVRNRSQALMAAFSGNPTELSVRVPAGVRASGR